MPPAPPVKRAPRDWRYVAGTFQVTIPVSTKDVLLFPEENTLAILKFRLQSTPASSRWFKVLERYVAYVAARVAGLGGNPDAIPPSPQGAPPPKVHDEDPTGKVVEVLFGCGGDFEGFVLSDCGKLHAFPTRERGFLEIALRCLRERLTVRVEVTAGDTARIEKLVILV